MAFPSSPANGATATVGGVEFVYDSTNDSWTRTSQGLSSTDVVFVTGAQTVAGSKTFSNTATFSNTVSVESVFETTTITASAPSLVQTFDAKAQSVQYFTSNSTTNFTLNIRGDSTTTLNSMLAVGETYVCSVLVTNGATGYYITAVNIDGTAQTVRWIGGSAPIAGFANSIDSYTFTIIKTAASTYTVMGSQTKYA